jgi:hypothetical protein
MITALVAAVTRTASMRHAIVLRKDPRTDTVSGVHHKLGVGPQLVAHVGGQAGDVLEPASHHPVQHPDFVGAPQLGAPTHTASSRGITSGVSRAVTRRRTGATDTTRDGP